MCEWLKGGTYVIWHVHMFVRWVCDFCVYKCVKCVWLLASVHVCLCFHVYMPGSVYSCVCIGVSLSLSEWVWLCESELEWVNCVIVCVYICECVFLCVCRCVSLLLSASEYEGVSEWQVCIMCDCMCVYMWVCISVRV